MKRTNVKSFILTFGIMCSGGILSGTAFAELLSKNQFDAESKRIESEYLASKVKCISLSGSDNEKCVADADVKKNEAKKLLDNKHQAPENSTLDQRFNKVDADYVTAKLKCVDTNTHSKVQCEKNAKVIRDLDIENIIKQKQLETPKANTMMFERKLKPQIKVMI